MVRLLLAVTCVTICARALAQDELPPRAGEAAVEDPSLAEERHREARALFDLAHAHYDAGRYAEAAAEFERAHALTGRAELLYDVHLARRDAGDVRGAAAALRGYLEGGVDIDPGLRRRLTRRLEAMEAALRAEETSTAELGVEVPGPDPPAEPTGGPTNTATSSDALIAPREGMVGTAAPAATAADDGLITLGVTLLATGGAALVGAGISGLAALRIADDRDTACRSGPTGAECPAGYDQSAAVGAFTAARDAGWTLFCVGLATVAGGALVALTGATAAPAAGACTSDGCVAVVQVPF